MARLAGHAEEVPFALLGEHLMIARGRIGTDRDAWTIDFARHVYLFHADARAATLPYGAEARGASVGSVAPTGSPQSCPPP